MTKNSALFSLVNKAVSSHHGKSQKTNVCTINEPNYQSAHQLNDLQRIFYPFHLKRMGAAS